MEREDFLTGDPKVVRKRMEALMGDLNAARKQIEVLDMGGRLAVECEHCKGKGSCPVEMRKEESGYYLECSTCLNYVRSPEAIAQMPHVLPSMPCMVCGGKGFNFIMVEKGYGILERLRR